MSSSLFSSLSLVDTSGSLIIIFIVLLLIVALGTNIAVRMTYRRIHADLRRSSTDEPVFRTPMLNKLVAAARRPGRKSSDGQALIEHLIQSELKGLLIGERLVKASGGLLIILGLVGTFYGLTESIGKLVALVSGDFDGASEVTESLVSGLTEALAGMSVAFTTSLVGILAAIVMTLVGVFANVAESRQSLMLELETFLDALEIAAQPSALVHGVAEASSGLGGASLGHVAAQLETSMLRFESALTQFSTTTREFKEFNLHLKDNVSRLSLCFGELSDTLKEHTAQVRRLSGAPQDWGKK